MQEGRDQAVTIVHVLPADLSRGAEAYARVVRDALDDARERHLLLTLFSSEAGMLRPDASLGVPQGRLRRLGMDPRVVRRLRRWLRRHPADVLVAHGGEPLKYLALARHQNQSLLYYRIGGTSIGADGRRRHALRRALYRGLIRRADLVAAVSEDVAVESAEVLGVPLATIPIIPNARDPERFRRAQLDADKEPHLLFVSHLVDDKRPAWFMAAVKALRGRGRSLTAAVVGDGPLAAALGEEAASAGVSLLGARSDVPELLAAADIFVFPSAAREGVPGVLIEAALAGLATVATDAPGVRRAVIDGETGLVVGLDDFEALVDAIDRLLTDRRLREQFGTAARAYAVSEFGTSEALDRWRSVLDHLLSRPA